MYKKDKYAGPRFVCCFVHLQNFCEIVRFKILRYRDVHVQKVPISPKLRPIFEVLSTLCRLFTLPLGPHSFELLAEKMNRPLSSICFDCSQTFGPDTF